MIVCISTDIYASEGSKHIVLSGVPHSHCLADCISFLVFNSVCAPCCCAACFCIFRLCVDKGISQN